MATHSPKEGLETILAQERAEPQGEVMDPVSGPAQDISWAPLWVGTSGVLPGSASTYGAVKLDKATRFSPKKRRVIKNLFLST